jgi:hypothetical protein
MYESLTLPTRDDAADIARHEVSEDGVNWRPYDPLRDAGRTLLHQRIEFAPLPEDARR